MQGGLIPRLVVRFGEVGLLRVSYLIQSPALAFIPFAHPWVPFAVVLFVFYTHLGHVLPSNY